MGRRYDGQFTEVAVTAQQDLFELVAPADAIVVVHTIYLVQITEVGDAQEEQLTILLKSGQTTTGSGGSVVTPAPVEFGDAAFGGTFKVNNTTKASAGTIVTHRPWGWNIRSEFERIFTPETFPILSPSRRMTIELATTPLDSITMSGYITFEEIGG